MEKFNDNRKKVFSVPDGYFEQLNRSIMNATAGKDAPAPRRKRFILGRFTGAVGYAACIALLLGLATTMFTPGKKTGGNTTIITANENGDIYNEYIDNIFNSCDIDEYTFYCYLTDSDFE